MISLSDYLAEVSAETMARLRRSGRLPHNDSPLSGSLGPDAGLPATIGPEPATGTSNRSPAEPPAVSGTASRPPDRAGKA